MYEGMPLAQMLARLPTTPGNFLLPLKVQTGEALSALAGHAAALLSVIRSI